MKFTSRGWAIYFACWIPYALSYVAVFFAQNRANLLPEIRTALLNVVPAALCGVLVIKLCEKLPWSRHRRIWFFPLHFLFALGYSGLWYVSVLLFFAGDRWLQTGKLAFYWFGGYAVQWQVFSGLMIYGTLASVIYALQIAENLRLESERAARAEMLAAQLQLAALRAQLNPHFLFNTLHSLMALIRYQPASAEHALERLAEMLRYVLQEKGDGGNAAAPVALRDERQFVENYLELEKLRFGDRLNIVGDFAPAALDCLLPALTLQPLVENAIKHGIAPRARTGTIFLSARKCGDNLELQVRDDGCGWADLAENGGLGLRLVRRQLQTHYGERAEMKIETAPEKGFAVKIKLPWQTIKSKTEKEPAEIAYSHAHR